MQSVEPGFTDTMGSRQAIQGWNMLSNGMGGIDWAGLPVVVEMLSVDDVEAFVADISAIRLHLSKSDDEMPVEDV